MDVLVRSLNPLLMFAMPLALGVFLARRLRVGWRLFAIGAVTFIGSQVLHIPFNQWVLAPGVEKLGLMGAPDFTSLVIVAVLFGLSAGLFEEIARFLVLRYWLREARSWREGMMFGAGHGGIEAILLGVLVVYGLIQMMAYRNADLSALVSPEELPLAQAQLEAYWALPWYDALLGALERAFALCIHLGAAVLVLQVFTRRNPIWLILAIGWHTLVNAVALISQSVWGIYVTMALIGLMAGLSLAMAFALRRFEGDEPPAAALPSLPAERLKGKLSIEEGPIPEERLDESRFQG